MCGCDFLIFPSEREKYLPPPLALLLPQKGEKKWSQELWIQVLLSLFFIFFPLLTLGDQIDRQSSSWEKKSDDWNTARGSLSSAARGYSDMTKFLINGVQGDTHFSINVQREMQVLKWLVKTLISELLLQKILYNEIELSRPWMVSRL